MLLLWLLRRRWQLHVRPLLLLLLRRWQPHARLLRLLGLLVEPVPRRLLPTPQPPLLPLLLPLRPPQRWAWQGL